jgi:cell division protease FtsH
MDRLPEEETSGNEEKRSSRPAGPSVMLLLLLILGFVFVSLFFSGFKAPEVKYSDFYAQLEAGNIQEFTFMKEIGEGRLKAAPKMTDAEKSTLAAEEEAKKNSKETIAFPTKPPSAEEAEIPPVWRATARRPKLDFAVNLPAASQSQANLLEKLREQKVIHDSQRPVDFASISLMIAILVPLVMVLLMWMTVRRSQNQLFGGSGFLSGFTKSPAKRYEGAKQGITFKDVAGLEGVKADLLEIVEFLKDPTKFQKLGGRVPKGVLLNGPPGTGKTLLARAIAGEAGVPFYSVNGSEFIQMFVGVGASRVRDLFRTAKETSPSIIFIDEIDAVGRQRGAGLGGGHDEREQTLNQILGEMDGFSQTDFVIVVAATNRPDVLDPALLRPGRFDRHVTVDRPTKKGRLELFKVHTRQVPLATDVNLDRMAAATIGLTGADIRNLVNEAALWAARHNKTAVAMDDFDYAHDKILMGAKREEVFSQKEKERTAYHEAGHAMLGWQSSSTRRVHKVTVIPRGRALGVTQFVPIDELANMNESDVKDELATLLAGRAAEKLIYNETTTGAVSDLERATDLTRRMVTIWGMSTRLGPVSYKLHDQDPFLGREMNRMREFSEHTLELIDEEVGRILHESADFALKYLSENRTKLEALTQALVQKEELDEKEIEAILGPAPVVERNKKSNKPPV